jgi:hypothetical protein
MSTLPAARWLVVLSALGVLLALGGASAVGAEPKAAVSLVVDYGDGVELHFTNLKWRDDMTVLDALAAAKAHRHGIMFSQRGSGSSALITKIGDQTNEGNGRNWIYYVNGKTGDVSAGVRPIKSGDAILWRFQTYDYNAASEKQ